MADTIDLLIQIQEQIIITRKFVAETDDAELARRLYEMADAVERRAREVSRIVRLGTRAALNVSVPREQQHSAYHY
jgi:hypothetical protein